MPLVRKRVLSEDENRLDAPTHKRFKSGRKELLEFEKIGYNQDHFHSLHRSLPNSLLALEKVLAKEIGSFLNGKGGILCFGCRPSGTVYGDPLPRKQEDNMKLVIDEIFKKFRPMVPPQRYRVTCTHLGGRYHGSDQRVVVEIRVQAGVDFEMYEDYNHETYLRKGNAPYGPLTPHEIKRFTTQQLRERLQALRPIQTALFSPPARKTPLQTVETAPPGKLVEKSTFRINLRQRKESSGSEEDPILVAVVRPVKPVSLGREGRREERDSGKIKEEEREKVVIDLTSPTLPQVTNEEVEEGEIVDNPADGGLPTASGRQRPPPMSSVVPSVGRGLLNKSSSVAHPLAHAVRSSAPGAISSTAVSSNSTTSSSNPQSTATRPVSTAKSTAVTSSNVAMTSSSTAKSTAVTSSNVAMTSLSTSKSTAVTSSNVTMTSLSTSKSTAVTSSTATMTSSSVSKPTVAPTVKCTSAPVLVQHVVVMRSKTTGAITTAKPSNPSSQPKAGNTSSSKAGPTTRSNLAVAKAIANAQPPTGKKTGSNNQVTRSSLAVAKSLLAVSQPPVAGKNDPTNTAAVSSVSNRASSTSAGRSSTKPAEALALALALAKSTTASTSLAGAPSRLPTTGVTSAKTAPLASSSSRPATRAAKVPPAPSSSSNTTSTAKTTTSSSNSATRASATSGKVSTATTSSCSGTTSVPITSAKVSNMSARSSVTSETSSNKSALSSVTATRVKAGSSTGKKLSVKPAKPVVQGTGGGNSGPAASKSAGVSTAKPVAKTGSTSSVGVASVKRVVPSITPKPIAAVIPASKQTTSKQVSKPGQPSSTTSSAASQTGTILVTTKPTPAGRKVPAKKPAPAKPALPPAAKTAPNRARPVNSSKRRSAIGSGQQIFSTSLGPHPYGHQRLNYRDFVGGAQFLPPPPLPPYPLPPPQPHPYGSQYYPPFNAHFGSSYYPTPVQAAWNMSTQHNVRRH